MHGLVGYEQNEAKVASARRDDITVRQNIEAKISFHQKAIESLEQSKDQLSPLLDMRIDLLRQAMML